LEAYVGGWAIARRAREAVTEDRISGRTILRIAQRVENITAETVSEGCRQRDRLSPRLMNETAELLGAGLAGIVNIFNPGRVILGGGIVDHHPKLVPRIRKIVNSRAQPPAARTVTILASRLGPDAGVIGAALLARHALNPRQS
jgi:glucokinase